MNIDSPSAAEADDMGVSATTPITPFSSCSEAPGTVRPTASNPPLSLCMNTLRAYIERHLPSHPLPAGRHRDRL